jgi:antitoxin component of MazEF toxin-antitoxin module
MPVETKLTKAATRTTSLRTTVPASIVKQFNLEEHDKISWKLKVEDGELVIVVSPVKRGEK